MRDFDEKRKEREERDRSFRLAGETFVCRPAVSPEAVIEWGKLTAGEYYARDETGSLVINPATMRPISTISEVETLAIFDTTVLAFLEPGQDEKWKQVRSVDAKHPVNLDDMTELVQWMWEQQAGHPTGEPSGSTDGSPSPATTERSTQGSSLRAVEG